MSDVRTGTDRLMVLVIVLVLAGILLWLAADVLLLIFAGILIAVGLDGVASAVERVSRIPRKVALLITALVLSGLLAGFAVLVVPRVIGQIDQFRDLFMSVFESARTTLGRWGWPEEVMDLGAVDQGRVLDVAGGIAGRVAGMTLAAVGAIGSFVIVIVIAMFLAFDPALYRNGLLALMPRHRGRIDAALSGVGHALRWWFLGQMVSMLLLAVTVSAGLWLLGVELWLSLGVLTGLLTFIPILGPIIAGVPIMIVAFAQGTGTGLSVLAFYLVIQNLEGNILVPYIQQRAVHLAPALLIAAQLLLGTLFGLPGFVLAAPLAVVAMVLVQRLYVEPTA